MMRIFLCLNCRRWQYVSDRLRGTCNQCRQEMLGTDVPFEDFVDLNERQRYEVIDDIIERGYGNDSLDEAASTVTVLTYDTAAKNRKTYAKRNKQNEEIRNLVGEYLGRHVMSNREAPEDTGYDY